jgi:hypothetical protein
LDGLLGALATAVARVRAEEGKLVMVFTDGMEIQVGDMAKALGEEDTFWETTMRAFGWSTLPRVKRCTLPRVGRDALPRVAESADRRRGTLPMLGAVGTSRARGR